MKGEEGRGGILFEQLNLGSHGDKGNTISAAK